MSNCGIEGRRLEETLLYILHAADKVAYDMFTSGKWSPEEFVEFMQTLRSVQLGVQRVLAFLEEEDTAQMEGTLL